MESEFFVESLRFNLSSFVKIDDIPFLVDLSSVRVNNDWASFNILAVFDFEDLHILSDIDELVSLVLEDLEPL
jgi:hypothetical protein